MNISNAEEPEWVEEKATFEMKAPILSIVSLGSTILGRGYHSYTYEVFHLANPSFLEPILKQLLLSNAGWMMKTEHIKVFPYHRSIVTITIDSSD